MMRKTINYGTLFKTGNRHLSGHVALQKYNARHKWAVGLPRTERSGSLLAKS
jgi:hypothetical protein